MACATKTSSDASSAAEFLRAPSFRSLNLAQAVQVTAYECQLGAEGRPRHSTRADTLCGATKHRQESAQLEVGITHLEQAMVAVGYLDPTIPSV